MVYTDFENSEYTIRVFKESLDPNELKWHRDDEDRAIYSIHKTDWLIQLENKLPEPLISLVFIERGQWHRLIKGTGELTLKIIKENI